MANMYIHIPFCLGKCDYCSFNSFAGMESLFHRYVAAVKKELRLLGQNYNRGPLETLFLGGGTPSVLSGDSIADIVLYCQEVFGFADDIEITIEANPKTIDFMKMLTLRKTGINRLSIGVQSFLDNELDVIGRLHSAQDSWNCVRDGVAGGFKNISVDLMYGLPGQTVATWEWNLETAVSLGVRHLSLYQLTLEEGTFLQKRVMNGEITLPGEEDILQMDTVTERLLCEQGRFKQYEISNYAMDGLFCKHNINYWHNNEYLAVGAGAVMFVDGKRIRNISDPYRYCERVENGADLVEEIEELSLEESFRETVVIGLRMVEGIDLGRLQMRYGIDFREYYGTYLATLVSGGMAKFEKNRFLLTARGRQIANQILAKLV